MIQPPLAPDTDPVRVLASLLYENEGRWFVGWQGDYDVTDWLAPELQARIAQEVADSLKPDTPTPKGTDR